MTVKDLIEILEDIENKEAVITCSNGNYGWSAEYVAVEEEVVEIG